MVDLLILFTFICVFCAGIGGALSLVEMVLRFFFGEKSCHRSAMRDWRDANREAHQ